MTLYQKILQMFLIMEYPLSGLQINVAALDAEQCETIIALDRWGMNLWAMFQDSPQFMNSMDQALFNAHRHNINKIRADLGLESWNLDHPF